MNGRRVLLTGASGQIGVFAIPRLVEAGFHIIAVSRKGRPEHFPEIEQVEWLNEPDAEKASSRCQYMLSAGPIALSHRFLAAGSQIQTAVVFSTSSVDSKLESANQSERDQVGSILEMEEKLQLQVQGRGMKLVIFRPTLIYGCGLDTNVSRLASWIRRFGFVPVNGRAAGLRQPVHADDLAEAATTALLSGKDLPTVLNLCGGESLSYFDMVRRIFMAVGKPERILKLPEWLFVLLVRMARVFTGSGSINEEMVRRQRIDLVFDDSQARALLGYDPRPFDPRESSSRKRT